MGEGGVMPTEQQTGTKMLSDAALADIESRLKDWDAGSQFPASWNNVRALCQTVRALRADRKTEMDRESKLVTDLEETINALREQLAQSQAENERLASQLKEWQEDKDTKAGYL